MRALVPYLSAGRKTGTPSPSVPLPSLWPRYTTVSQDMSLEEQAVEVPEVVRSEELDLGLPADRLLILESLLCSSAGAKFNRNKYWPENWPGMPNCKRLMYELLEGIYMVKLNVPRKI